MGGVVDIVSVLRDIKRVDCERLLKILASTLLAGFKADDIKNYFAEIQRRSNYFKTLETFLPLAPPNFYYGKLETFLTCLALSSYLRKNFLDEETGSLFQDFSLKAMCRSLTFGVSFAEWKLFVKELPNILLMPLPAVNMLINALFEIIPRLQNQCRIYDMMAWREFVNLDDLFRMLKVFDSYAHK